MSGQDKLDAAQDPPRHPPAAGFVKVRKRIQNKAISRTAASASQLSESTFCASRCVDPSCFSAWGMSGAFDLIAARRSASTNEEAARAIVNHLYADVFVAGRVAEMGKRRNALMQQQALCGEEAAAPWQALQQHDCITIYIGVSGSLVTEVYEHSTRCMRLSYHELYQEARRSLGLQMRATSISLALVSRYDHAPCQLNAGEIVPAHSGACFAELRGSVLDAILHR